MSYTYAKVSIHTAPEGAVKHVGRLDLIHTALKVSIHTAPEGAVKRRKEARTPVLQRVSIHTAPEGAVKRVLHGLSAP